MDWNSSNENETETDGGGIVVVVESSASSNNIANVGGSSANMDFSNLNTNNYDTHLNLNLNQLSQLISLNSDTVNGSSVGVGTANGNDLIGADDALITNTNANSSSSSSTSTTTNANNPVVDSEMNGISLVKSQIDAFSDHSSNNVDKAIKTVVGNNNAPLLMISNKNFKLIELTLDNNNNPFSIQLNPTNDTISFLNDLILPPTITNNTNTNTTASTTSTLVSSNTTTNTTTTNNNNIHSSTNNHLDEAKNNLDNGNSPKKYNYKCQYCFHLTKFKAHIIEHMQAIHNINLMQCPYLECGRKFKDEWKLKRHLITNKEHAKIGQFKDLNDCLRQHVYVSPQKVGLFPCPMCQLDEQSGQVFSINSNEVNFDQQAVISNLIAKNIDNSLYFESYETLRRHVLDTHQQFNIENYFVCKQCGQVFLNRYKLSCHLFNVHSGKRKRRSKVLCASSTNNTLTLSNSSNNNSTQFINSSNFNHNEIDDEIDEMSGGHLKSSGGHSSTNFEFNDENITNIIDYVAKGFDSGRNNNSTTTTTPSAATNTTTTTTTTVTLRQEPYFFTNQPNHHHYNHNHSQHNSAEFLAMAKKYLCIVCKRKFRRVRDLQTHVSIMHKGLSDTEREMIRLEIEKTNQMLTNLRVKSRGGGNHNNFVIANVISNANQHPQTSSSLNKVCPICNKLFKIDANSTGLNKTFMRHMQIQHGLNERGEKLVDCPVCEKWFFNKKQMERHMRTHQSWIPNTNVDQTPKVPLQITDFKEKHSILYCHECFECGIYFKSLKTLTRHKLDQHGLKPVYKCAASLNECGVQFETVEEFLEHAKVHCQKNIVCTKCSIKFNSKNSLRHHMKVAHYKASCVKRGSRSGRNRLTEKSMTINQGGENINISINQKSIGGSSSHSKNQLVQIVQNHQNHNSHQHQIHQHHQHQHHHNHNHEQQLATTPKKSEFVCPTCQEDFCSKNALHNHLATHSTTDLKLFMCALCSDSFKTRKELSQHATMHEYAKHKTCAECGETFKTSFHLKRHSLTRHSNIRPFRCIHCDMTFARKDKLKQHEAKHVNHPLYKCSQCTKGFYRKEHLKDHEISKHSKQYPFSCEHCQKGFVHAKDLHRHIRVRHLGATLASELLLQPEKQPQQQQQHHSQQNQQQQQQQHHQLFSLSEQQPVIYSTINSTPIVQVITKEKQQKPTTKIEITNNSNLNTSTSNDFKSKKISSILKSNLYLNSSSSNTSLVNQPQQQPQQQQQQHQQQTQHQMNQPQLQMQLQQQQQKQILQPNENLIQQIQVIDFGMLSNQNNNSNQLNSNGLIKLNSFKIRDQLLITDQQQQQQQLQQQHQLQKAIGNQRPENTINSILNSLKPPPQPPSQPQPQPSITNQQEAPKATNNKKTSAHPYLKSFACSTCSRTFFYENHLRKHILSKHTVHPQFSCSFCHKGFSTRATAKSHADNAHCEHVCPVCYKSFRTRSHAQRHMDKLHSSINNETLNPIRDDKIQAKVLDLAGSQLTTTSGTTAKALNVISVNTNSDITNNLVNTINTNNANVNANVNNFTGAQAFNLVNFSNYPTTLTWSNNFNISTNGVSSISSASPISSSASTSSTSHSPSTQNHQLFISSQQLQQLQQHQQQQQIQLQQQHQQQQQQMQQIPKQVIVSTTNMIGNNVSTNNTNNPSTYFLS